ncbi:DNA replication endonuclease-helicase Dna2 [Umbelopsis nana]
MSDSLRTPLKQDDDNPSGDHTPDDWFRSPTVKTLRRRQLNLGQEDDEKFPAWFAHRADAQTAFNRPAASIDDLFALDYSPSSPLSSMHTRDKTTQELNVGASGSAIPLLQKLKLEQPHRDHAKKRPFTATKASSAKKTRDTPISSQEDDDFGDDIPIEDLDALLAIAGATSPEGKVPVRTIAKDFDAMKRPKKYGRFLVMEVHSTAYTLDDSNTQLPEKTLYLLNEKENKEHTVKLREDWSHCAIAVGDLIHVICPNPQANEIVIDNRQNLLILHPDILISSTAVSDSFICLRKAVLRDRIRDMADYNEALVHGLIMHRVFQSSIQSGDFSYKTLKHEIEKAVTESVEELYAIDQSEQTAMLVLEKLVPNMQAWAAAYLTSQPKASVVTDRGPSFGQHRPDPVVVGVEKVLDVEEHIWSPMYGLKGMIDVTVQAKIRQGSDTHTLTIPMEIKTGRKNKILAHRAQTILYTLLMHDRYEIDIDAALLFYSMSNDVLLIPPLRDEVRGLIIGRNALASAFKDSQHLPPMIKNLHTCQRCYSIDACVIYHKSHERGSNRSSGLGKIFGDKTNHLIDTHVEFFRQWERLIQLEEGDTHRIRKDIWEAESAAKEKIGRCWCHLELVGKSTHPDDVGQHVYEFRRHRDMLDADDADKVAELHTHMSIGDPIVVSSETDHINLGIGFVARVRSNTVSVSLTRPFRGLPSRITTYFDEKENQTFVGIKDSPRRDTTHYRIDRDEISSGMGLVRNNLLTLFLKKEDGGDAKRRRLIVDLEEPRFHTNKSYIDQHSNQHLNADQLRAADQVLNAQDYCLILGMPGTGKTTTIAHIIDILVKQGKSILLTSYTHTAVDNVLSKVRDNGIDVLRIGNPEKVTPGLRDCMPNFDNSPKTVQQLVELYQTRPVVGTTCLGIGHSMFRRRQFDYCIVDEASQLTLPVCLGPLRYAKVFVLVGDHYQLPPLVRNEEASQKGLTKSLFKLLSEVHPNAVVYLEHQYRMNKDIMTLANHLIYDNKLKCGTETVAHMQLDIPSSSAGSRGLHVFSQKHLKTGACVGGPCWLEDVIDPRQVFMNTDAVPAQDSRVSANTLHNETEATLVHQTVEMLLAKGVHETKIGVITPYRSQLQLIARMLKGRERVEVHTIDKYQGRDKECVIVSLVRSNPNGNTGDLLKDWRRLNVALTRAKRKLIVFGSRSTLSHAALFRSFLQLVDEHRWTYSLPKDAHLLHHVPQPPSQSPQKPSSSSRKTHTAGVTQLFKDREILRDVYNSI